MKIEMGEYYRTSRNQLIKVVAECKNEVTNEDEIIYCYVNKGGYASPLYSRSRDLFENIVALSVQRR